MKLARFSAIPNVAANHRSVVVALLAVGVFWTPFAGAQDPNSSPVRSYSPASSMIENTPPGYVPRESLEILQTEGGPVAPVAAEVVKMSEILEAPPEEFLGGLRSHIQGDPAEGGGVTGGDLEGGKPPGPASEPPEEYRGASYLNFEAIDSSGWIPPDTVVAVGAHDIVEATNSGFAIYSKTGRQIQGYTTFASFFGTSETLFDPRIVYNPQKNRYVILILERNVANQTSRLRIAISQRAWADGDWWRWNFDVEHTDGLDWMDYATLGADDFGIYFSGNMYNWAGGFRWAKLWTLGPAMWTGGSGSGWQWWDLQFSGGDSAFGLQFADPHGVNSNEESYFVNTWSGFGSEVGLWTVTGDRSGATGGPSLAVTTITGLPSYYSLGENVDQPGSSTDIDGGDSRVMNAKYVNRRVFFTLGTDVNDDGTDGGWYTVKLNSDTATVDWSYVQWTNNEYYTYPALTLAGGSNGANIGVIGTWTNGTDRYPSTIFKIYDDHPTSGGGEFALYKGGTSPYVSLDTNGRNRWGDYSGADYDWTCGHLVGAAEFTDATNSWSTQILMTTFAAELACPRIDITNPGDGDSLIGGKTYSIGWSRLNLPPTDDIFVFYSLDDALTWTQIGGALPASATSLSWTTPIFSSTGLGKIFIGSWDGGAYTAQDRSDFNFDMVGCVDDGYEPNDVCFGNSITIGTTQSHKACDNDWIAFIPTPGASYRIETSALLNGADTVVSMHTNCGTMVAFDDDGGAGVASLIDYTATSGIALDLEVTMFGAAYAADKGYNVSVTCTECCDGSCFLFADGFESGNTGAWAP